MTPAMARTILERAGTVPVECHSLIGFEPETRALDANNDRNSVMLAKVIEDNRGMGLDTAIVKDATGRLSAWVRKNHFWS